MNCGVVVHIRKALARVRETCNNDWELKEIEIYRKDEADEILKLVENSGRNWVQGYDAFSPNDKNLRVAHSAVYVTGPFTKEVIYFE